MIGAEKSKTISVTEDILKSMIGNSFSIKNHFTLTFLKNRSESDLRDSFNMLCELGLKKDEIGRRVELLRFNKEKLINNFNRLIELGVPMKKS